MKLSFKRLCCMGMALLFSLNLANVSMGVKAAPVSAVTEKEAAVARCDDHGNFVVTKEMMQEIIDQRIKNVKSDKSAVATLLLAVFGGEFGLHRFYVGKWGTGILYLFTCGLFGIGYMVDLINIALENFDDSKGFPIKF